MRRLCLCVLFVTACVELELHADLEGPRVLASSLPRPRNVEVATMPAIVLDFSEQIDPATLVIALVPWEEQGSCTFTPRCAAEGTSCERGRCMRDPLTAAAIKKLADGPIEGGVALSEPVLTPSPLASGTRVTVTPRRALQARARHSLLVFTRDRSGAPLVDDDGLTGVWRRDLVTADEGSGGPEAILVSPPSGATDVPPNLAHVLTQFARPVTLDPAATLTLEPESGAALTLVDPQPCPGWVPGMCLRWTPSGPVLFDMAYRPGGGTLRDRLGRPAVPPAAATWFVTAAAPDTTPPSLDDATLTHLGPCVYVRLTASEPLTLDLHVGDAHDSAVTGPGPVTLALRAATGEATLRAEDLAGNHAERTLEAVPEDSRPAPPLGLAEILANPRGPEPAQEFIELVDLRDNGEPHPWTDLHLTDRSASAVARSLAIDERPGDLLPAFTTRPGERVIVVAASFDPSEGSDPAPAPSTQILRVDASLGAGGLKNAGEPITLYHAPTDAPATIVASYADHIPTGAPAHAGRSVVASPHACDLARAWTSHPAGTSTPGAAP